MKKLVSIRRSQDHHWVGDGFPVQKIFSYNDTPQALSPFLLLDYAAPTSFAPTTHQRGVGQHPHRGFETVTIVYEGEVSHRDSAGGGGTIGPGDVQWMTAGSGLVHEEYHGPDYARRGGPFEMVQLWVNLPARDKMAAPGYQGITDATIPKVDLPQGSGSVRVIAGEYGGARGPTRTFTPMNVWDLRLKAGQPVEFKLPEGHTTALMVLKGAIRAGGSEQVVGEVEMAVMERAGDLLRVQAVQDATVLLLSGEPIDEPVVGYGPFVMNTEEQIHQAFADFKAGRMGRITAAAA
ncbi:pirin family protein [uncultured Ramlibacter sp.]|uniref:pirin family protein n=1 Tax=uncultured Ramlibacter sp. TaxID=260755 RepID=UPI002618EF42|nr:pirin family protein [uncultured Ramlibacter sp.]